MFLLFFWGGGGGEGLETKIVFEISLPGGMTGTLRRLGS